MFRALGSPDTVSDSVARYETVLRNYNWSAVKDRWPGSAKPPATRSPKSFALLADGLPQVCFIVAAGLWEYTTRWQLCNDESGISHIDRAPWNTCCGPVGQLLQQMALRCLAGVDLLSIRELSIDKGKFGYTSWDVH